MYELFVAAIIASVVFGVFAIGALFTDIIYPAYLAWITEQVRRDQIGR